MNRRALGLLSVGVFALLLATVSGHLYSIDGLQYYRVATELVFDGSVIFDPPLRWGESITTPITTIGYSLVQVPAVLLAWPFWHLQPVGDPAVAYDQNLLYRDGLYAATSWVNPAIVSLTAVLSALFAIRLGLSPQRSIVVGLIAVFGTPLFFYARADFLQPLVALLLIAILLATLHLRDGRSLPFGLLAVLVAWATMTRPPDAAIAVATAAAALALPGLRYRPLADGRRAGVELSAGVTCGLLVAFFVNYVRRGAPFDFGYPADGFTGSLPHMLVAELASPGRGLLWYLPLTFLALAGGITVWRRGKRLEFMVLAVPVLAYIVLYGFWMGLGGWAYGPRFLIPLAPAIVLLAAGTLIDPLFRRRVAIFGLLAAAGVVANAAHLAVDQLRFWGAYGDSVFGTAAFERQFESAAFAPIGSWSLYDNVTGPDIAWIREASSSSGHGLVVFLLLLLVGAVSLGAALWQARHGSDWAFGRTADLVS